MSYVYAGRLEVVWDVDPESVQSNFSVYAWQAGGPMVFCETASPQSDVAVFQNWLFI